MDDDKTMLLHLLRKMKVEFEDCGRYVQANVGISYIRFWFDQQGNITEMIWG